jgi:hypothetical protein
MPTAASIGDLTLQVYWDDNADKLSRFVQIINASDYIIIPTIINTADHAPARTIPLTTYYYRELLGCPQGGGHRML